MHSFKPKLKTSWETIEFNFLDQTSASKSWPKFNFKIFLKLQPSLKLTNTASVRLSTHPHQTESHQSGWINSCQSVSERRGRWPDLGPIMSWAVDFIHERALKKKAQREMHLQSLSNYHQQCLLFVLSYVQVSMLQLRMLCPSLHLDCFLCKFFFHNSVLTFVMLIMKHCVYDEQRCKKMIGIVFQSSAPKHSYV